MELALGLWATPLFLLPGVALLVMSTAIRLNRLHDEVHDLVEHSGIDLGDEAVDLVRRARLFRDALVTLYVAVALLALAGLTGAIALTVAGFGGRTVVVVLTGGAVLAILWASFLLIRESRQALRAIVRHVEGG